MDFDQGLVAPFCSVERFLELHRRDVAEVAVQAFLVVPVDPSEGGQFDVFDGLPGPAFTRRPTNQLCLVVAVDGLGQRVEAPMSSDVLESTVVA